MFDNKVYQHNISNFTYNSQQSMSRLHRNNTEIIPDRYPQVSPAYNKSPIRRQTTHNMNPTRSPLRSRTPSRHVSPLKQPQQAMPIKFISTLSPSKEKQNNLENQPQFSNGKSIKYIHQNLTDKNYQNNKKYDMNKKTDRNTQEDNRLFGKIVDKLNSQKKPGLRSNECSYKTSIFGDNSDHKSVRMEQTTGKPEPGIFKQLFNQFKTNDPRVEAKSTSKQKDPSPSEENEGLSCLVYKIKNNMKVEKDEGRSQRKERSKVKDLTSANTPSILLKRQTSRAEEEQRRDSSPLQKKNVSSRREEEQDFNDFNMLLTKIEQEYRASSRPSGEDLVKMSFRVQQSMSMDPYI